LKLYPTPNYDWSLEEIEDPSWSDLLFSDLLRQDDSQMLEDPEISLESGEIPASPKYVLSDPEVKLSFTLHQVPLYI
jgi:hypothetical protein